MKKNKFSGKAIIPGLLMAVFTLPSYAQLSGTYTVGGATPDYPNIVAAVNDLNNQGVSGAVTFNIRTGTYTGQVIINKVTGASSTNTITFQSETHDPADVTVNFGPGSSNNYIIRLNNADYITLREITVTTTASSYGRLIELTSSASNNTIEKCILDAVGTSSDMACIWGDDIKGTDNTFRQNKLTGGYYGIYMTGTSTSAANMIKNTVIENNLYSEVYYYANYLYYQQNIKFRKNTIVKTGSGTHYGARMYYCNDGMEFTDNNISLDGTGTRYGLYGYYNDRGVLIKNNVIKILSTGTKYGMRLYYNDGTAAEPDIVINNSIAIDCGSSTGYGIYTRYGKYNNVANNSVSVNSTSTTSVAGYFYYSSTSYTNNNIYNNAFANVSGSGAGMYVYSYASNYNNSWDYNNIYSPGTTLVETGSPSGSHATLNAWNTVSDQDKHSISYDPGFTSLTDLTPDVNNPASWSLNGRALHIQDNNLDINNNARIETRAQGVPDIGAYEFEPDVAPPLADVTPSTAEPGDTQIFTFGQREVGRIKWGTKSSIAQLQVRQYSGRRAPGIAAAANPSGSMYFYTDIVGQGAATDLFYELNVDYMDIWLGDIPNDIALKLAHQTSSYPWMVYNGSLSTVNTANKDIDAPKVTNFGKYTGLEDGVIPSAFVYTPGNSIICIGNSVILNAEPTNGDNYKWYFNGNEIIGAGGPNAKTYTATQGGQYSVAITFGSKVAESVPVAISTIAAPNAVVTASGPLTYCTGNGLQLDAGINTGLKYQWQLNGLNIPGETNNTLQIAQAGKYTVVVENAGCSSISSDVDIQAGPLYVSLGNDTTYCEVPNVWHKLDAGYPGATYTWSTGETSQEVEIKKEGTYWVKVDGGPNCIATDTIKVVIDPLPSANGISYVQNGNSYKFSVSNPEDVAGVMWLFSDGTVSNQDNPEKTIQGDLYVRVVLYNACGTDTVQLGWPLTVGNVVNEEAVSVYPNPAAERLNVHVGGGAMVKQVTIVNNLGAVVSSTEFNSVSKLSVDVAMLPAGNYFVKIETDRGVVNKRFSVVR